MKRNAPLIRILVIIFLLIAVLLPFILSNKYQAWFLYEGVKGYTFSIVLCVLVSLVLAAIGSYFSEKIIIIICGILFSISYYVNSESRKNIMLDNQRWSQVEKIFETNRFKSALEESPIVFAPVLWDHSWWMGFHKDIEIDYWKIYSRKFSREINFSKIRGLDDKVTIFDYQLDSIILSYKSDHIKNEISNLFIAYPSDQTFLLYHNDVLLKPGADILCTATLCEALFPGAFSKNIFVMTPQGKINLRVF